MSNKTQPKKATKKNQPPATNQSMPDQDSSSSSDYDTESFIVPERPDCGDFAHMDPDELKEAMQNITGKAGRVANFNAFNITARVFNKLWDQKPLNEDELLEVM